MLGQPEGEPPAASDLNTAKLVDALSAAAVRLRDLDNTSGFTEQMKTSLRRIDGLHSLRVTQTQ
jgi:hypothetical protein